MRKRVLLVAAAAGTGFLLSAGIIYGVTRRTASVTVTKRPHISLSGGDALYQWDFEARSVQAVEVDHLLVSEGQCRTLSTARFQADERRMAGQIAVWQRYEAAQDEVEAPEQEIVCLVDSGGTLQLKQVDSPGLLPARLLSTSSAPDITLRTGESRQILNAAFGPPSLGSWSQSIELERNIELTADAPYSMLIVQVRVE